jgi:putative phosphoserine phosphatase/1-acylglycerol-3-phosphate O-acyltransferase
VGAVFVDLDRTLLRRASGPILEAALLEEGVVGKRRGGPANRLLYGYYDWFGENLLAMGFARLAATVARGWSAEAVARAGRRAIDGLHARIAPFAPEILQGYREQGLQLVLATTTPFDLISPFAEALGFDDVVATRYEVADGRYTGRLTGGFVWGLGKLAAVRQWASTHGVALDECHACSDSIFDVPLLSSVGTPHAVNPDASLAALARVRGWSIEHWDRPKGVPSLVGFEPYDLLRHAVRPEAFPYARFDVEGLEHVPDQGPVVLAANHRSYFDVAALAVVAARLGRPVRFLAKRQLFGAPLLGSLARAIGGIPVDRDGRGAEAVRTAESALRAGEVVLILPQGTIPRGEAFFDPVLQGKTGAVRLAQATGAALVPVGIWGTDRVWPRSAYVPDVTRVLDPVPVRVRVGPALPPGTGLVAEETVALMAAISALLPPEATVERAPTEDELRRTFPPRRPGGRPAGAAPA